MYVVYIYIYTYLYCPYGGSIWPDRAPYGAQHGAHKGPYGTPTGGPKGLRLEPPMVGPYGIPLWVPMGPKGAPICVFPKCSHKSKMYKSNKRERDTELKTI